MRCGINIISLIIFISATLCAEDHTVSTVKTLANGETVKLITLNHGEFQAKISTWGAEIITLAAKGYNWPPLEVSQPDQSSASLFDHQGFTIALDSFKRGPNPISQVNWQIESVSSKPDGTKIAVLKHVFPCPRSSELNCLSKYSLIFPQENPVTVWLEFQMQEVMPMGAGAMMSDFLGELTIRISMEPTNYPIDDLYIEHRMAFEKRDSITWQYKDPNLAFPNWVRLGEFNNHLLPATNLETYGQYYYHLFGEGSAVFRAEEKTLSKNSRSLSIHSSCANQWLFTNKINPFLNIYPPDTIAKSETLNNYSLSTFDFPDVDLKLPLLTQQSRGSVVIKNNLTNNTFDYSRRIYRHPLHRKIVDGREIIDTIKMSVWIEGNLKF